MKETDPYASPASDLASGDSFGQKDEDLSKPRRFLGLRRSEWFMIALFVATVIILMIAFLTPAATI